MCGFWAFAILNMFDNDRAFLSRGFAREFAGSFTDWREGLGPEGIAGCWCGRGGRGGGGFGTEGLCDPLVLAWEDLKIVGGRKVCMLIRDLRLAGPEELLDLVVPVL